MGGSLCEGTGAKGSVAVCGQKREQGTMAEGEYLEIYSQYMEEKGNQAQASIRFLLAMEEYDWAKRD